MYMPGWPLGDLSKREYKELIAEKDRIYKDIKDFEDGKFSIDGFFDDPGADVKYQQNLIYLSKLCEWIVQKFIQEDIFNQQDFWDKVINNSSHNDVL